MARLATRFRIRALGPCRPRRSAAAKCARRGWSVPVGWHQGGHDHRRLPRDRQGHRSSSWPRRPRHKSPEVDAIAARLIRLLPQSGDGMTTGANRTAAGAAQSASYWWVWLCFALAMSFLMPHQPTTSTNLGTATSESGPNEHRKADVSVPPKSTVTPPNGVDILR